MLTSNPYLLFNGQCEQAFQYYEKCLGGKIEFIMRFGESPDKASIPPGMEDKIIHMTLKFGGNVLQGSDAPPNHYSRPEGFSVTLGTDDIGEAGRIYKALAENGQVQMPLQETFWAVRFAMLTDQFGTPWMINCGKPQ